MLNQRHGRKLVPWFLSWHILSLSMPVVYCPNFLFSSPFKLPVKSPRLNNSILAPPTIKRDNRICAYCFIVPSCCTKSPEFQVLSIAHKQQNFLTPLLFCTGLDCFYYRTGHCLHECGDVNQSTQNSIKPFLWVFARPACDSTHWELFSSIDFLSQKIVIYEICAKGKSVIQAFAIVIAVLHLSRSSILILGGIFCFPPFVPGLVAGRSLVESNHQHPPLHIAHQ